MPERLPSLRPSRATIPSLPTPDRTSEAKARQSWYRSKRWQGTRRIKLQASPLCERCQAEGRITPASHVHHKIEVAEDISLALDLDNLESLCLSCHSRHHASERGRASGSGG